MKDTILFGDCRETLSQIDEKVRMCVTSPPYYGLRNYGDEDKQIGQEDTPEEYMGDVVGDLSRRRGVVGGMDDGPSGKVITGEVPLAEMFGYATDLRSATQGRATFTMEPLKYQEVPPNVAEAVISKNE